MQSLDEENSRHIHLQNNATVKYQMYIPKDGIYSIIMNIVTVHADCKPLRIRANKMEKNVLIPYTAGEWFSTKPVFFQLSKGINEFEVMTEEKGYITIKDFIIRMEESV
jgi:hypothetical protein